MTKGELASLKSLFLDLKNIMEKYTRCVQRVQLNYVYDIIDIIDSNLSENDKVGLIIENYNSLYPPYGGLRELYVQDDDFQVMRAVNIKLGDIQNKIWDIMQNYV